MSGERAQTRGRHARIEQRPTRTGSQIVTRIEIVLDDNVFEGQVMLEPQQTLVLAQSGYAGRKGTVFPDADNETVLTLYYVMAADPES